MAGAFLAEIRRNRGLQPLANRPSRLVAEKLPSLGDVGLGVTDISWPERPVLGFARRRLGDDPRNLLANHPVQLVERRALADCDIVDVVDRLVLFGSARSQKVRLYDVVYVAEVPAGLAGAVDRAALPLRKSGNPAWITAA